ncbi:MAG: hypothetical protein WC683_10700 [bacterium]
MGRAWTEEIERRWDLSREETTSWEVMHEEEGFEDLGFMADEEISDLDGQETHIHFHHSKLGTERKH